MKINKDRIQQNLEELALFGKDTEGGITRSIGSESELKARQWLLKKADSLGASIAIDSIANIWIQTNTVKDIE